MNEVQVLTHLVELPDLSVTVCGIQIADYQEVTKHELEVSLDKEIVTCETCQYLSLSK